MLKSTVHEYHQGTVQVSTNPSATPTSDSLAFKYHWFIEQVETDFIVEIIKYGKQNVGFSRREFNKNNYGELVSFYVVVNSFD